MKRTVLKLMVFVLAVLLFSFAKVEAGSESTQNVTLTRVDSSAFRWLDVADQAYRIDYQSTYDYSQATVEVTYHKVDATFCGMVTAQNLKPNFAYQLKLEGTPGTDDNERIGLVGRWWQEEWDGSAGSNGKNLNNKGDGSSPNLNDNVYFGRRNDPHYRFTGYLVFDYFITDNNGDASFSFEANSSYHVLWNTSQRVRTASDGPLKTVTFDPDPLTEPAYDTDYASSTVSIFGEWERLPMGAVYLLPGEYNCKILLTEESFHGSGGSLAGAWAGAMNGDITFTIITPPFVVDEVPLGTIAALLIPFAFLSIYAIKRKHKTLRA